MWTAYNWKGLPEGENRFRSFLGAGEGEAGPTFRILFFRNGKGGSGELYALGQPWWVRLHWQPCHRSLTGPVQSSHNRLRCGILGGSGFNFGHRDSETRRRLVLFICFEGGGFYVAKASLDLVIYLRMVLNV